MTARTDRGPRGARGARGARPACGRDQPPEPGGVPEPGTEGPPGDPEAVARLICLRQLTLAPRTRAQLAELLRSRGIPEPVAEHVLSRFGAVGLVDDEAFARAWVSSRHRSRGLAGRALGAELRRRGVDPETVQEAVSELDPAVEEATARRLVGAKIPGLARVDRATATRRLVAMLARKGYPPGMAFGIIRAELDAAAEQSGSGHGGSGQSGSVRARSVQADDVEVDVWGIGADDTL